MQKASDKARLNDDIRRRIESLVKVKASFQNIASTADKLGVTLPKGLKDALGDVENEYRALLDLSERKLRIAVAGKYSCGKSQFVNSLVGKEIASVDSGRATCCKTIFTGDTAVNEVVISDSTGRTCSRDEYVRRSAKGSASREVFTVRLPDADWRDFEVIDTPGYDSTEKGDQQISEEAVADADVVFFLFDMNDGTIPKDSIEYLKKSVSANQLVYLVANKADLKSEGARRTIMKSVSSECDRNELKYESILPYSSLMPWSKVLDNKNEVARTNVLKIARQLKVEALDVIKKLVERASAIRDAKIAVELKAIDGLLADFQENIVDAFVASLEGVLSKSRESVESRCESLFEEVLSVLQESAIENTERRASSFVRWHELKSTGIFFSDWSVYLARPTSEYDLPDEERASLSQALSSQFAEHGISRADVVEELVELRKECAIRAIDKYRIKDEDAPSGDDALFFYTAALEHRDFCKTCDYESERRDRENSILANLNRVFPSAFAELLGEKIAKVIERVGIEEFLKPTVNAVFESFKVLADFNDSCSDALNVAINGHTYVAETLMAIDVLPSPIEGTVVFSVETGDKVEKGQVLGRAVLRDSDAGVTLCAIKSGQVVVLAEQGASVPKFTPLLIILSEDEEENVNAKAESGGSHSNGSGDEIVSTVEGVVDALFVEDGSAVKQGNRLLTINVLNIHWPINAIRDGRISIKVKLGEHVSPGNVLATIS